MTTDEFVDVEIVDVEPDPALIWSGETIMVKKKKKNETTVISGGVNLLNTVIGAGILSIPFAIARQGIVFGTFLILAVAFLTHVSMTMLSKVGEQLLNDFFAYSAVPLPSRSVTPASTPSPRLSLDAIRPEAETVRRSVDDRRSVDGRKSVDDRKSVDGRKSSDTPSSTSPNERAQSPTGIIRPDSQPSSRPTSIDLIRTDLSPDSTSVAVDRKSQELMRPAVTFPWVAKSVRPWLAVVLNIAMVVFCLGVCVAYLILIGDSMPQIIGFIVDDHQSSSVLTLSEGFSSSLSESVKLPALRRRELWISVAVIVISPFTFLKRLDSLRFLSWANVGCVAYMLFVLIYYFFRDFDRIFSDDNSYELGPADSSAINNISVIIFSYTCQPNFFSVFDELSDKNRRKRANGSSAIACSASGILYSLFGVIGYFIGGPGVASNVINSLPTYDTIVLIARVTLICVVSFSYSMIMFPMRVCVEAMFNGPRFQRFSEIARRIVIAVVLVLITWAIAMIFEELDVVLALTGATGATILSFVLPGYLLWLVFPQQRKCPEGWFQIIGLVLAIFGLVFMVASVILTFIHM